MCVCVCVWVSVSVCIVAGCACLCLCNTILCAESRRSKVQVSSQAREDSRERLMNAMTVFLEKQQSLPQGHSDEKQAVSPLWQTRYMDAARLVCRLSSSASHWIFTSFFCVYSSSLRRPLAIPTRNCQRQRKTNWTQRLSMRCCCGLKPFRSIPGRRGSLRGRPSLTRGSLGPTSCLSISDRLGEILRSQS